jgi:adenylate cyclase
MLLDQVENMSLPGSRSGASRETLASLRGKLRRAELMLNMNQRITSLTSLDEVISVIEEIVAKEMNAERASVFLNDHTTNELFANVIQGPRCLRIRILNETGIAGTVFHTGRGEIVHEAYADPRFNRNIDIWTKFKTKGIACAPIKTAKGEIIGVIEALNPHSGRFDLQDLEFLESMAQQSSVALQGLQYMERIAKTRKEEMEFLDHLVNITSSLDISVLLSRVMTEAGRMLKADRCTLFLNNKKRNELWSEVGHGLNTVQIRLPNNVGIAGAVFKTGETINIAHAYADLRFDPSFDKKTGYFTRSIICMPVNNKSGQTIGVVQALNKQGGIFTTEDEARLKAFCAEVSIALENASLFDDVQNMKNYTQAMLESMSNGVITLNEEGHIHTCNAAGYHILHATEDKLINLPAQVFFTGPNQWLGERISRATESESVDVMMDGELSFGDDVLHVNVTIQPLLSLKSKRLGTMVMLEDITTEKRMKSAMSRYMAPTLVDKLVAGDILVGQNLQATVLFADIRAFTELASALGPQNTVATLNECFSIMSASVLEEGGILDKFIGDAIMAEFGIPLPHEDDPDSAVRAAIKMITNIGIYSVQRIERGERPIEIGIGLNTDEVISGNIGSSKRMDYTVIGEGVNIASRLESACKKYHAKILCSGRTYKQLKGIYKSREIDLVVLKGSHQPISIYEILDYHSNESFPNMYSVFEFFEKGLRSYREQNFDEALAHFRKALELNPSDRINQIYIDRCKHFKDNPPEKDWDGSWVMEEK